MCIIHKHLHVVAINVTRVSAALYSAAISHKKELLAHFTAIKVKFNSLLFTTNTNVAWCFKSEAPKPDAE